MDTKAGLKAFSSGRREIFLIDPRTIITERGFNARDFSVPENQEHVDRLMASIVSEGMKTPLTVRLHQEKVYLVDGESRLRAVMQAIDAGQAIETVPCQAEDRYSNDADRVVGLITRNSGKSLLPMEQAAVVKRLLALGLDEVKIAERLGFSKSYIAHLQNLLAMPEAAQAAVRAGSVAASTALEMVGKDGAGVQVLKDAVATAKAAGKKKATKKHTRKTAEPAAAPMTRVAKTDLEKLYDFVDYIAQTAQNITEARAKAEALKKKFGI